MTKTPVKSIRLTGQVVDWDAYNTAEFGIIADECAAYRARGYEILQVAGKTIAFKTRPFDDGTVQIQSKSDMMGRIDAAGGHANWGYSGYFRGYVHLGGKRKKLANFWKLFPNGEHRYAAQQDKPTAEAAIREAIGRRAGSMVVKVKGGYAFDVDNEG
jgi:hypothetical protein